jgi:hypothetical protein
LIFDVTTGDASLGATDSCFIDYSVEGYDWAKVAQREFTLSFWIFTTVTGTYSVNFTNNVDRSYVSEFTVSASDTWEKVTITVDPSPSAGTWNYTNGLGLRIRVWFAAGSSFQTGTLDTWNSAINQASSNQVNAVETASNTIRFALFQLEEGSTVTPFEIRSIGEENALCQRYCVKTYDLGVDQGTVTDVGALVDVSPGAANNDVQATWNLPVSMRAVPSVTTYSTGTGTQGKWTRDSDGVEINSQILSAGQNSISIDNTETTLSESRHRIHAIAKAEL